MGNGTTSRKHGTTSSGVTSGRAAMAGRRRAVWLATRVVVLAAAVLAVGAGSQVVGSSARGGEVLRERDCLRCHALGGEGGATAPDLGRRSLATRRTPADLAALMWNHGPDMWRERAPGAEEILPAAGTEADDLLAYFWGLRYFDRAGEAGRGKRLFASKGCVGCHALNEGGEGVFEGPPVSDWEGLGDPVQWAQELWNHSREMNRRLAARGLEWPRFSEQEMVDLLVYLQNLDPARPATRRLALASPELGRAVFESKGCVSCHGLDAGEAAGQAEAVPLRGFSTMTGFTAEMWNHAPEMQARGRALGLDPGTFEVEEMRALISYLYVSGSFEEQGDARKGRGVYTRKECGSCHGDPDTGVPRLLGDERASAARVATAVWSHGPQMLEEMERRGLQWPTLSARDVADLVAFLNETRG